MASGGSRRLAVDHRVYRFESPPAALALWEEIEVKIGRLPDNPRLYRRGRVDGTREMVVRPNYLVVYAETSEMVTILRVLHAAQMWP